MERITDTDEKLELRSEEVQEILGTPPHWLVRYGMLLGLAMIIGLAWASYWIEYPETVEARIRVTSEEGVLRLYAENTSEVTHVLVENEDPVEAGQTILAYSSQAKYEDVHTLENYLLSVKDRGDSALLSLEIPRDLILGELDEPLFRFLEIQEEVNESLTGRIASLSSSQKRTRIRQEQTNITFERRRIDNLQSQMESTQKRYLREQNLLASGIGDANRVRLLQEEVLTIERQIQNAESTIKNKEYEIRMLRRELEDNALTATLSTSEAIEDLRESIAALQRAVDNWKKTFLLVSRVDGVAVLRNEIREGHFVQQGDELGAVVPPNESSRLVGRTDLELSESGQIRPGQRVIVNFFNFPAQRYGAVEGFISFKSKVPTEEGTLPVEVRFPNGLVTNTGQVLEVEQDMGADMTIIIQEKRLIEWLLDRI